MSPSDQPSLFGDGAAPEPPSDRLLFAVFPPPQIAAQITRIGEAAQASQRLRGPLLTADRLHITLIHIGDYVGLPREAVARARAAAEAVIAQPFEVRFDRAASFRNGPFVLLGEEDDLAPLHAFRRSLAQSVARTGLKTKSSLTQFKPHVTLLYDKATLAPEHAVEPVGWTVGEFALIHSLLGRTTHLDLGRWPLAG